MRYQVIFECGESVALEVVSQLKSKHKVIPLVREVEGRGSPSLILNGDAAMAHLQAYSLVERIAEDSRKDKSLTEAEIRAYASTIALISI